MQPKPPAQPVKTKEGLNAAISNARSKYVVRVDEANAERGIELPNRATKLIPHEQAPKQTIPNKLVRETLITHANNLMLKHRDMTELLKTYEENMSRLDHSEFVFVTGKTNKIDQQIEKIRNKISHKSIVFLKWEHERRVQLEVKLQEVSQQYRLKVSDLEAEYRMEKSKQDQDLQDALLKSQSRTLGGDWQELVDPTTQSVYYLNTTTGHSQWERPAEISASADEIAAVTCAICLDVLKGACVQCKNGHLFCRDCLRLHLAASQNPTCPTCRVYIENDGIRNKMAEQVAKKLSGLNDVDLEAKMKASPEHVLSEHKKVMATMTRSLEIERMYQHTQTFIFNCPD